MKGRIIGISFLVVFLAVGAYFYIDGDKPKETEEVKDGHENTGDIANGKDEVVLEKVQGTIRRVIDGDTISVNLDVNQEEIVQLIGIDSPEQNHPDLGTQAFGNDAYNYTSSFLKIGQSVTLELGQPQRDQEGSLRAFVWVDGQNFNEHLVNKGFARVVKSDIPTGKQVEALIKAEEYAKLNGANIWSVEGYATESGFDMAVIEN